MKATLMVIVFLAILILVVPAVLKVRTDTVPKEINMDACERAGGQWNECGSVCTGEDPDTCPPAAVCIPMCQCGTRSGFSCPPGYYCKLSGNITDELGRCVKQ